MPTSRVGVLPHSKLATESSYSFQFLAGFQFAVSKNRFDRKLDLGSPPKDHLLVFIGHCMLLLRHLYPSPFGLIMAYIAGSAGVRLR